MVSKTATHHTSKTSDGTAGWQGRTLDWRLRLWHLRLHLRLRHLLSLCTLRHLLSLQWCTLHRKCYIVVLLATSNNRACDGKMYLRLLQCVQHIPISRFVLGLVQLQAWWSLIQQAG